MLHHQETSTTARLARLTSPTSDVSGYLLALLSPHPLQTLKSASPARRKSALAVHLLPRPARRNKPCAARSPLAVFFFPPPNSPRVYHDRQSKLILFSSLEVRTLGAYALRPALLFTPRFRHPTLSVRNRLIIFENHTTTWFPISLPLLGRRPVGHLCHYATFHTIECFQSCGAVVPAPNSYHCVISTVPQHHSQSPARRRIRRLHTAERSDLIVSASEP